jgi:uncharacterized protein (DUF1501 family)
MRNQRNNPGGASGPQGPSRRDFIRRACCAAVGTSAVASTVWDMRMINAAAAQVVGLNDYKALVCLFLYGGNDGHNLVVPTDSAGYSAYASHRGGLTIPSSQLNAINPVNTGGRTFGFHPQCPELASLFNTGKLAVLFNVGTLVVPTTRAQYFANSVPLPPQLFSHNDQQVQWQTSVPDQVSRTGWAGRSADLLASLNGNSTVSMSMSLAGANVWEVGNQVSQYAVSVNGSIGLDSGQTPPDRVAAVRALLQTPHSNLYEQAFAQTMTRAIDNDALLKGALSSVPALQTAFPDTTLAKQLKMIARLISARNALGHKRQIYFAAVIGYDLHGGQMSPHADLMKELSGAMKSFYDATVELGVSNSVTTFTASDFGRTLMCNGTGSDHGWGNHQLVMGGAVQGQRCFGTFPTLSIDGPDDTGLGRYIPSTSVDEYSATLAKWFGVSTTNLSTVFPNLNRFTKPDLGFLA